LGCNGLFGSEEEVFCPAVVDGGLGEGFCDDCWLVELNSESEVDEWVEKASFGVSLSFFIGKRR